MAASSRSWMSLRTALSPPLQAHHPRHCHVSCSLLLPGAFIIALRSKWVHLSHEYSSGTLLSVPITQWFSTDAPTERLQELFVPSKSTALSSRAGTRQYLVLNVLEDVRTTMRVWGAHAGMARRVK